MRATGISDHSAEDSDVGGTDTRSPEKLSGVVLVFRWASLVLLQRWGTCITHGFCHPYTRACVSENPVFLHLIEDLDCLRK